MGKDEDQEESQYGILSVVASNHPSILMFDEPAKR